MKTMKEDDYSKAFHGNEEMSEAVDIDPSAAEGVSDEPAVAVMIAEEPADEGGMGDELADKPEDTVGDQVEEDPTPAPEPGSDPEESMTPEEVQQERSWRGRLEARERELAEREAALAAKSSGDDVERFADGGEVEVMPDDEPPMEPTVDTANEEVAIEDGGDEVAPTVSAEALVAKAMEMAQDPEKVNALLQTMVNDYGEDFVVAMMAATSPVVHKLADPYVSNLEGRLEQVISSLSDAWQSRHREQIADAHEDFEEIAESPEFEEFIGSMPEEEKARAMQTIENGSTVRVIKLLSTFKDWRDAKSAPSEPSPEDIWAEDAAAAVKNSAPVNVPSARAPKDSGDEYKKAWDQA